MAKVKTKVFSKPLHYWSVKEKQIVNSLMNQGKNAARIKKELYKGDKTVSVRSLATLMNLIRNKPSWVNHHPKTNTPGNPNYNPDGKISKEIINQDVETEVFELDIAYKEFMDFKLENQRFLHAMKVMVENLSPLGEKANQEIFEFAKNQSKIEISKRQKEFLKIVK